MEKKIFDTAAAALTEYDKDVQKFDRVQLYQIADKFIIFADNDYKLIKEYIKTDQENVIDPGLIKD